MYDTNYQIPAIKDRLPLLPFEDRFTKDEFVTRDWDSPVVTVTEGRKLILALHADGLGSHGEIIGPDAEKDFYDRSVGTIRKATKVGSLEVSLKMAFWGQFRNASGPEEECFNLSGTLNNHMVRIILALDPYAIDLSKSWQTLVHPGQNLSRSDGYNIKNESTGFWVHNELIFRGTGEEILSVGGAKTLMGLHQAAERVNRIFSAPFKQSWPSDVL